MIIQVSELTKYLGAKELFSNLNFTLYPGERIALIGRNGHGKTTLFRLLTGHDTEYHGQIEKPKDVRIVLTQQEHHNTTSQTALEHILQNVPQFKELQKTILDYEQGINLDIQLYSDAVTLFSEKGYYYITDLILESLNDFQIPTTKSQGPFTNLSGGEKRLVELVKVMYSQADLLLIDEPTNHMDYIAKQNFINWLNSTTSSVIVISHDRDVLKHVQRIAEIKDKQITFFDGNYSKYIIQNTQQTTNAVIQYNNNLKRLADAKEKVEWGNRMRAKSKAWKIRYDHWLKDYEKIRADTVKPSFWIDQDSTEDLDKEIKESYQKFKEKNISIHTTQSKEKRDALIKIEHLSLGYTTPLFKDLNIDIGTKDKVFIKGRNGAGKSTLLKTIIATHLGQTPQATIFEGKIKIAQDVKIGEYQQEISPEYLNLTLAEGVKNAYQDHGIDIPIQKIKALLAQYLFDPTLDEKQKIAHLSGGQKARFQVIKMLANDPNILILDEPTNHLDLPSIEELENALIAFQGGILFTSHDTYFIKKLADKTVEI